jgi:cellulose synthase/poly-beta-1,6-N-acetylglucosamine synthase-like glycosyltransferase
MTNCVDKEIYSYRTISIGIPVYNEEDNIGKLAESILNQNEFDFLEAIFVLSGCNDKSEEIIKRLMEVDNRIKLILQKNREGKASAINLILKRAKGRIVIISSSDIVLDSNCLRNLLVPFQEARIGMAGVRPFPIRNSNNFIYQLNKIIWQLHHELCLKSPKLGETIAFRNVVDEIPIDCAADESCIEAFIKSKGYDLCYKEDAFVYNRCPSKLKDLFLQRVRIFLGHIDVKEKYGYKAASMNTLLILRIAVEYIIKKPHMFIPFLVLGILEFFARIIATYMYYLTKEPIPFIWSTYKK